MLKFFATNRAMEHLPRPARRKLSKGGYYFVDMEKYMSFYLETTDEGKMPECAVVEDSPNEVFIKFLENEQVGNIVVCVHGYNVELHEASTWFRILTDTMKNQSPYRNRVVTSPAELAAKQEEAKCLTAFVGFSWPSNGNVLRYHEDQREAIQSAAAFGSLLARLKMTGKSVNLICHSMGNFLACHTFACLVNESSVPRKAINCGKTMGLFEEKPEHDDWLINNFVMIAPDVERRHVTKSEIGDSDYVGQFYSGLQHLVRRKINFYSRFDLVLGISSIEKTMRETGLKIGDMASKVPFGLLDFLKRNPDQRWEKRLGEAPAPINAAPGFTSVNATEWANREIGHSDHIDSREVVLRIAKELQIVSKGDNPCEK